jgi:hypothetical protein
MYVQVAKQPTKGFVLVSGESLIAKHQNVVFKKRSFYGVHRFRAKVSQINASDFRANGGCD